MTKERDASSEFRNLAEFLRACLRKDLPEGVDLDEILSAVRRVVETTRRTKLKPSDVEAAIERLGASAQKFAEALQPFIDEEQSTGAEQDDNRRLGHLASAVLSTAFSRATGQDVFGDFGRLEAARFAADTSRVFVNAWELRVALEAIKRASKTALAKPREKVDDPLQAEAIRQMASVGGASDREINRAKQIGKRAVVSPIFGNHGSFKFGDQRALAIRLATIWNLATGKQVKSTSGDEYGDFARFCRLVAHLNADVAEIMTGKGGAGGSIVAFVRLASHEFNS